MELRHGAEAQSRQLMCPHALNSNGPGLNCTDTTQGLASASRLAYQRFAHLGETLPLRVPPDQLRTPPGPPPSSSSACLRAS